LNYFLQQCALQFSYMTTNKRLQQEQPAAKRATTNARLQTNYNLTKCNTHTDTHTYVHVVCSCNCNCGIGSQATKCCAVSGACKWRGQSGSQIRNAKGGQRGGEACVNHCKKQPSYLMVIHITNTWHFIWLKSLKVVKINLNILNYMT